MTDTVISFAQYRVKPDAEEQFKDALRRHTATLRDLELITDRPVEVFAGSEKNVEGPLFVEIFEWADARSVELAHTHPDVSTVWESMGELCESRGGRPMFEFSNLRPVDVG
jgi:quinol monooxygenase YgiN